MSTTSPTSELHLAMQSWHAALARSELEAQIAAHLPSRPPSRPRSMRTGSTALRSIVDILVAGGLDERIEEIARPASHETGTVLPLLRHANRLTRELGHLAACQLATARTLEHSLARRIAAPPPAPIRPAPQARHRRLVRLDLASLIVMLAMAAYAGFLLASITYRPPTPLFPYGIPAPLPPPPAPAKPAADPINATLTPPAAPAARMPHAS